MCDDAEALWKYWQKLCNDPTGRLRVVRLKNKISRAQTPHNYHINATFLPDGFARPIVVEIQLWCTKIMALNDTSHWEYEVARAATPEAV